MTRISDMLESTNIEVVAKVIGHHNINSTKVYDRVKVDFESIHEKVDTFRQVEIEQLLIKQLLLKPLAGQL